MDLNFKRTLARLIRRSARGIPSQPSKPLNFTQAGSFRCVFLIVYARGS
jgi:hypothetical protein